MADQTEQDKIFTDLVSSAGIPTTDVEVKAKWDEQVAESEVTVDNNSPYSPFWNFVNAVITTPVLWLVQLLITTILPNLFLKYAEDAMLDIIAWAYGLTRKLASKTRGNLTFTRAETVGTLDIPAGTIIQSPPINGVIYRMITLADAVFADGQASMNVLCEAEFAGQDYNLANNYYAILTQPIDGVDGVTNGSSWITIPGADVESNDDLRYRCRNQFNTLSAYHIDAAYKAIISTFPGVLVENIYFEHDAPRGPGTANAYILFAQDAPVDDYIAAINNFITGQNYHGLGDDLQVYNMPATPGDISMTWVPVTGLSDDDITALNAQIIDFIRAAFRENASYTPTLTHPNGRFSFSVLTKELHGEFEGIYSLKFTAPSDDITTAMAVATIGTLTVAPET
jgi:uncharacterized phage protein gp47/JayE